MADDAGSWTRPDMGVNPDDYLEDDRDVDDGPDRAPHPDEERPADPLAPGQSVVDEDDGDIVEPNEPG